MQIQSVKVGRLECNCYILDIDNYVLIVDPGDDYEKIKKTIGNRKILGILITHNHFDHVGALSDFINEKNVRIYRCDNVEEKKYKCGPFEFEIIFTKGHSEDSISFYFDKENIMFVGDFIFANSIGRCDLEGGDISKMKESIKMIKKYDDNIILYPGHGNKTSLGIEKENNYFFKEENL